MAKKGSFSKVYDKNGDYVDVEAARFDGSRTFQMQGDVTATQTWNGDPSTPLTLNASIGAKKVTTDKINDKAVGAAQLADDAVGLTQIDDNAMTSAATSGDDRLITSGGVRTEIDNAILNRGKDYGPMTPTQINAISETIPTGSTVHVTAAGTITDGDIEVRQGEDLKYYRGNGEHYWYSMDGDFKLKQQAKTSPAASGSALEFIDSYSQDENGEFTGTKKAVQDGTTSQKGVVQLEDSHSSTSTTKAATPNSVKEAYDLANTANTGAVKNVAYDSTNKKITKTINGTTSDVVSAATLKTDMALNNVDNTSDANKPVSTAQQAALDLKLDKTGDGKDVTATFTEASTRENIGTGEKLSVIFGKIKKWFSDIGTAAFKNVPASGNASSTEVVLGSDTRLSAGASAVQDVTVDGASVVNSSTKVAAVPDASTSAKGAVQLAGSIGATVSSENNKAATEKAVRDALNTKNDLHAIRLTSEDDLNSIANTFYDGTLQVYNWLGTSTPSNSPSGDSAATMIQYGIANTSGSKNCCQIVYTVGQFFYFSRTCNAGTWNPWRRVYYEATSTYSSTGTQAVNGTAVAYALSSYELLSNKVSSWQSTPDNTHYPSEKLVKDALDEKLRFIKLTSESSINLNNLINTSFCELYAPSFENSPVSGPELSLLVTDMRGRKFQMLMSANDLGPTHNVRLFIRQHNMSSWGTWVELSNTSAVDAKADKVANATSGNFAGLDSNGNLTDSGSKASDFANADNAVIVSNSIIYTASGNTRSYYKVAEIDVLQNYTSAILSCDYLVAPGNDHGERGTLDLNFRVKDDTSWGLKDFYARQEYSTVVNNYGLQFIVIATKNTTGTHIDLYVSLASGLTGFELSRRFRKSSGTTLGDEWTFVDTPTASSTAPTVPEGAVSSTITPEVRDVVTLTSSDNIDSINVNTTAPKNFMLMSSDFPSGTFPTGVSATNCYMQCFGHGNRQNQVLYVEINGVQNIYIRKSYGGTPPNLTWRAWQSERDASWINSGTFGTARIADDAITAAKVKDGEKLPVNVSGNAGTATHLSAFGRLRMWSALDASKPYFLIAEFNPSSLTGGAGQVFKLEYASDFVIFQVKAVWNSSNFYYPSILYISSSRDFSFFDDKFKVTYTYDSSASYARAYLRIYVIPKAQYVAITLRQLDNQSGDAYCYVDWEAFTFHSSTSTADMVASFVGTEFTDKTYVVSSEYSATSETPISGKGVASAIAGKQDALSFMDNTEAHSLWTNAKANAS